MRFARVQLVALMALLLSSAGFSQEDQSSTIPLKDGNDMLEECTRAVHSMEGHYDNSSASVLEALRDGASFQRIGRYLMGWIQGFNSGIVFSGGGLGKKPYCMPQEVTVGQTVRVIKKYLEDHPERLNEDVSTLVFTAFRSSFPCRPQKQAGK